MVKTVIPARAGSKRVPHKNVRLVAGKPLITHAIEAALGEVVVDTDDPQVESIARLHGIEVVHRDPALADDKATIDDLVKSYMPQDETLLLLQPTVLHRNLPVIIESFYEAFEESGADSWTLGTPINHLVWEGNSPPAIRTNSQTLLANYAQEVGARLYAAGTSDPAPQDVFVVEGLFDIDTHEDLAACRVALEEGRVFFRLVANETLGSGHLFRCVSLATELDHHAVGFNLVGSTPKWAEERISPWPLTELPHDLSGAVVVNDTLDTTEVEIADLKSRGAKIVSLEDSGAGARLADIVINSMYQTGASNERSGPKWSVIRPEFSPVPFSISNRWRLLVTFGGTDPSHLTELAIKELGDIPAEVRFIQPPGRKVTGDSRLIFDASMASEMAWADLVITSGGRTVYEAAALGRPVVTILQNPREAIHEHLNSVVNLGLGALLSPGRMREAITTIMGNSHILYDLVEKQSIDNRGAQRIAAEIEALL